MSRTEFGLTVGAMLGFVLFTAAISIGTHSVTESGIYCFLTWAGNGAARLAAWNTVIFSSASVLGILAFYARIYWHSIAVLRRTSQLQQKGLHSVAPPGSVNSRHSVTSKPSVTLCDVPPAETLHSAARDSRERAVLTRCVVIFLAFASLYAPVFFLFGYRLLTQHLVDERLDAASVLLADLDCVISPALFLYFNKGYRRALRCQ